MEERLGRLLAMTGKLVREHFDRDLQTAGSSLNTFLVLHIADECPGVSQRELAGRIGIEGPTLTRHLDRLAADGLLSRVPNRSDRRIWHVELTPAGQAHLKRVDAFARARECEFRSLLTPEEAETLAALLTRIRTHLLEKEDDVHSSAS